MKSKRKEKTHLFTDTPHIFICLDFSFIVVASHDQKYVNLQRVQVLTGCYNPREKLNALGVDTKN